MLQERPQLMPSQVGLPWGTASHGVQSAPQEVIAESETQVSEHRCVPLGHSHEWLAVAQVRPPVHSLSLVQPGWQVPLAASQ